MYPRICWLVCWLYWWLLPDWGRFTVPVREMLLYFDLLDVWGLTEGVSFPSPLTSALWLSESRPLVPEDTWAYRTAAWVWEALGGAASQQRRSWPVSPHVLINPRDRFSSEWMDSCFCKSVRGVSHVFRDEVRTRGHTVWSESLHLCWKKTKMWAYD